MNLIYEPHDKAKIKELGLADTSASHNWVRNEDYSLILYETGGGHELFDFHVRRWQFVYGGKVPWVSLAAGVSGKDKEEHEYVYWIDKKDNYSFMPSDWLRHLTEALIIVKAYDTTYEVLKRQINPPTPEPFRVTIKIGPLTSNEYADSVPVDPELFSAQCVYCWTGREAVPLE